MVKTAIVLVLLANVTGARAVLWLSVFAMSALKFIPGVAMSLAFKFSFWEHFITTAGGGITGVVAFTYFGDAIRRWWRRRTGPKRPKFEDWGDEPLLEAAAPLQPEPDRTSFAYRVWDRYGLFGAALLTPPVLSPPIGSMLAVGFGTPKPKIILYMTISFILWGVFTGLAGRALFEALGLN